MKKIVVLIFVVGVVYWQVSKETVIDRLMSVELPVQAGETDGVRYYEPERGSVVDMSEFAEPGRITVVHLYKPSCRGCQILSKEMSKLLSIRPDIAVIQVQSIPGIYEPINQSMKLNVKFVPFVMIFDKTGILLASDNGDENDGRDLFYQWLNAEVDRKNEQLQNEWASKQS